MGTRLLLLALLAAANLCCLNAESQTQKFAFVSGKTECLDCADKNVEPELAYEGLQVAINCKSHSGGYKIKGTGNLDKNGEYKVELPTELIGDDGKLKHDCFAQLHSVSNTPCLNENELNPAKLVLESAKDGAHAFSTTKKLPFSSATCASAFFFWHKHPHKKFLPPFKFPPKPHFHKKSLPPVPFKKPLLPPVPIKKPLPPPVPIKKPLLPPVPIKKPLPPPVPIKKPLLPPVPVKKPLPVPIYKKPCPPLYKKPIPHWPEIPPVYKKPFPHFPKYPPVAEKPLHP